MYSSRYHWSGALHTSCKNMSWLSYRLRSPVTSHDRPARAMTCQKYMSSSHVAVMRVKALWNPVHSHCARDRSGGFCTGARSDQVTCNFTGAGCHVTPAGQGKLIQIHVTLLHPVTWVIKKGEKKWLLPKSRGNDTRRSQRYIDKEVAEKEMWSWTNREMKERE